MKNFKWLILIMCTVLLVGCATILGSKNNMISVTSEPSRSKVYINGVYRGLTPLSLAIEPNSSLNILVKKKGYDDATAAIQRNIQGIAFLNLLNPVCWIIDFASGAIYKFNQNAITVQLSKVGAAFQSSPVRTGDKLVRLVKGSKTYVYLPEN